MSNRKIPLLGLVSLNFEEIAQMADREVFGHLAVVCRLSKKRLIPKRIKYDAFRVSRVPNAVTLHLLKGDLETMRVSFIPSPDFSQLR